MTNGEEIGIISEAGYGLRDRNRPFLYFTVETLRGSALQCFFQPDADAILTAFGATDVPRLNGQACVVTVKDQMVRLVRPLRGGPIAWEKTP